MNNKIYIASVFILISSFFNGLSVNAEPLDRIVAIVEDDVILERELSFETHNIVRKLKANKVMIPPSFILRKQVLERLILTKLQRLQADRSGIRVGGEMLHAAVTDIAQRNGLSLSDFRVELEGQGIKFSVFEESIRNEIIVNQLRAREVGSRIRVTDREISHYLETQGVTNKEQVEYHIGHILISLPEAASPSEISTAKSKATSIVNDLKKGADFKQTAVKVSEGSNALNGGDLGWRTVGQTPTIFVDSMTKMNQGDISEIIRSPSGFHIIKMLELKGVKHHIVTKTRARHILIKTNELIDDAEAKNRLLSLKERVIDGDDFALLARSNSDDKGSAINGGDLGWVGPGDLVKPFEVAMNKLPLDGISDPVQTQFGWHLIQVQEREDKDNSIQFKKNKVREEIRNKKIEEETELWLRRLRDEAYVDINLDRL